ncbi:SDR family NAD(P)-dependent oxidoreductase [Noviherbaspirillum pedocola]|uniref:SDR family oxidoreductase n=1 Tax=Noviherbaspirillum pedocola TaxID=2801341 RepID=A0A934SZH6_9BURK|nr:glucose 1-dehydrogenase [Noviherbaspirillum pedocola]MBK4739380.1 SDR family oxidoreductase [Noviherbaspirillum pedocola]
MSLKNKVALVTGAASGIGRSIALALARDGSKVLVTDRSDDGGHETVELILKAGGVARFCQLDAANPDDHHRAVAQANEHFGGLHIACNNAGISVGPGKIYAPVAEIALKDWDQMLAINLSGVFYGLRAQIPAMIAYGGGSIVNTASVMGQVAGQNLGAYVASKHGVIGLTKSAALDYAGKGIRVNAIGPGYIATPMLEHKDPKTLSGLAAKHPMGRLGLPQEIAELAAWLSSERASFVTGAYYPVDGGYLAQ